MHHHAEWGCSVNSESIIVYLVDHPPPTSLREQ
jgi:hypothetical protein